MRVSPLTHPRINTLEESNTYRSIYLEGWLQGYAEGREESRQALRGNLLTILRTRFGELPAEVVEAVASVTDFAELRTSIRYAATCATLHDFRAS